VAIIWRRTVPIIRIPVAILVAAELSNLGEMRRVPSVHIFRIWKNGTTWRVQSIQGT
jgi:hypothetical protein